MNLPARPSHIIRNDEVTLTECGLFLATFPTAADDTPQPIATLGYTSEVAVWDNVAPPAGTFTCHGCWATYEDGGRR